MLISVSINSEPKNFSAARNASNIAGGCVLGKTKMETPQQCLPCNQKWQRTVKGAIGLGKIITHTDPAAADTIERRLAVCGTCPALKQLIPRGAGVVGIGDICRECGCVLLAKVRIQSETCPQGKWHE